MVAHSAVTTFHEPKGVAAATAGQVYVADGAASGTHKKITTAEIDATSIFDSNVYELNASILDISASNPEFVVAPYAGTITKIWTVIDGAISGADAVLSFEIAGVPVTDGGITVAFSGSAAGDVDSATPSAANVVTAGQAIELITDQGSTGTVKAQITIEMLRTA